MFPAFNQYNMMMMMIMMMIVIIVMILVMMMMMMIIVIMIAIRIVMMMIVMLMISNMMDNIISMHLYYESGAVAAVAVDRSVTSSCMNRTRRSYR